MMKDNEKGKAVKKKKKAKKQKQSNQAVNTMDIF